jgi:hypothetical protein
VLREHPAQVTVTVEPLALPIKIPELEMPTAVMLVKYIDESSCHPIEIGTAEEDAVNPVSETVELKRPSSETMNDPTCCAPFTPAKFTHEDESVAPARRPLSVDVGWQVTDTFAPSSVDEDLSTALEKFNGVSATLKTTFDVTPEKFAKNWPAAELADTLTTRSSTVSLNDSTDPAAESDDDDVKDSAVSPDTSPATKTAASPAAFHDDPTVVILREVHAPPKYTTDCVALSTVEADSIVVESAVAVTNTR